MCTTQKKKCEWGGRLRVPIGAKLKNKKAVMASMVLADKGDEADIASLVKSGGGSHGKWVFVIF
jgi:hypothetical protein